MLMGPTIAAPPRSNLPQRTRIATVDGPFDGAVKLASRLSGGSEAPVDKNATGSMSRFIARILERLSLNRGMTKPPPWVISMLLHLGLLLALALISLAVSHPHRHRVTLRYGDWQPQLELSEISIELAAEPTQAATETKYHEPDFDIRSFQFDRPVVAQVQTAPRSALIDQLISRPRIDASVMARLPVNTSTMFDGRTGAKKQELLKRYGGTEVTESAVDLGLVWLKRQQLSDGNWSMRGPYGEGSFSENKTAATAMAMLAFMGAGSTHRSGPYAKEVLRAVHWLVERQDRSGFMAADANSHEKMYAQAQATIALCELYAMTGDSWLRPFAQAACNFAGSSQSAGGGWRYQPRADGDTSVTGWFLMGLKSGQAAGLTVDGKVVDRIGNYLDTVSGRYDEGYSYMPGERASPSMTAEGLLCRQYLGWQRNAAAMTHGLTALEANHPIDRIRPDVYYWYYATQAMHHYGGPLWDDWNAVLRVELPAMQETVGPERGSWPPQRDAWGRLGGRLYTTCFSLFSLEVYYRHMPLYRHDEVEVW